MSSDFWRLGMSAQMGQNCPTKAFFVAWSQLCFKYYVLWPVCHTYSTSQCLWMTWQWNSWNSHYIVFCSIVPISVSRISMLCHYIVGHCKNMRSKPILSLYWSFSTWRVSWSPFHERVLWKHHKEFGQNRTPISFVIINLVICTYVSIYFAFSLFLQAA